MFLFQGMYKTKFKEICSRCPWIGWCSPEMPALVMAPAHFNIAVEGQQREHRSLFICQFQKHSPRFLQDGVSSSFSFVTGEVARLQDNRASGQKCVTTTLIHYLLLECRSYLGLKPDQSGSVLRCCHCPKLQTFLFLRYVPGWPLGKEYCVHLSRRIDFCHSFLLFTTTAFNIVPETLTWYHQVHCVGSYEMNSESRRPPATPWFQRESRLQILHQFCSSLSFSPRGEVPPASPC